jgi:VanZ family protein
VSFGEDRHLDEGSPPWYSPGVTRSLWSRLSAVAAGLVAVAILVLSVVRDAPVMGEHNEDKLAHLAAYLVLGFLLTLAAETGSGTRRPAFLRILAPLSCVAYGVALELLQALVGRNCNALDALADLTGTALGWGLALAVTRAWKLSLRDRRAGGAQ